MLEKRVCLRPLRVHQEKEKFLLLQTSIAEFTHKILCDDGSYPLESNAFLCAPNNALIDGRVAFATPSLKPLLVFWQDRSSDVESKDGEVSVGDVQRWYQKAWTALGKFAEHFELCLFFASNRRLAFRGELEEGALATQLPKPLTRDSRGLPRLALPHIRASRASGTGPFGVSKTK